MLTQQKLKCLGIPSDVLAILRCPSCRSTLTELEEGLVCRRNGHSYPLVNGIVRFVPAEDYAGTFGFQWKRHAHTQLDRDGACESERDFRERTGLSPQELSGKLVLDVGCGMGRFAEVTSRWGARVVGVDLSNAAEVAAQNLSDRHAVAFFQADVFSLPFALESFDYIYSLGVLHHTPDCERAFKVLPGFLKLGGTIAIWLYSGYNKWYRFSDFYREFTHRLPAPWLHALCHVAIPLYYVHQGLRRLPLVGRPCSGLLHHVLPVCMHSNPEIRVLDTFDWYSPKYQSKHTYEEVFRWFESCGLESLRVLEQSISIRGRKPLERVGSHAKEDMSVIPGILRAECAAADGAGTVRHASCKIAMGGERPAADAGTRGDVQNLTFGTLREPSSLTSDEAPEESLAAEDCALPDRNPCHETRFVDGEDRVENEREGFFSKLGHASCWLPRYAWQRLARSSSCSGPSHLILALADHFEPAILPGDNEKRAVREVQEQRLEHWCRAYPKVVRDWPDSDGQFFCHTYFYPAEQYDKGVIDRLAEHCIEGWGEIEIHLHHGVEAPGTAEKTRRQLLEFRDALAAHGCLSGGIEQGPPRYAFVHGNFTLANSGNGVACGVDNEMQILADTGCYADFTLPSAPNASQVAKINSLYECALPLDRRAPHRAGRNLRCGRTPQTFPLIVQGPLMVDFSRRKRGWPFPCIENGSLTTAHPPTLKRLKLWKEAAITVHGRPDWLFIKLSCHGMDSRDEDAMLGTCLSGFLRDLTEEERGGEFQVHFVTAREMVNIILAACDGREGNPRDYRNYQLMLLRDRPSLSSDRARRPETVVKGL